MKILEVKFSKNIEDLWKVFSHANSKAAGLSRKKTIVLFMFVVIILIILN